MRKLKLKNKFSKLSIKLQNHQNNKIKFLYHTIPTIILYKNPTYNNNNYMGCLCNNPINKPKQIQNLSNLQIHDNHQQNIALAIKYREQGKNHFNNRNFLNAIQSYKLAIINDPNNLVHFTNLALAQKASKQFLSSIQTINQMEKQFKSVASQGNKAYLVKGIIIKARCQTIEAANYIFKKQNSRQTDSSQAKTLIKNAIQSLFHLNNQTSMTQVAKQLNIQKYLQNANKINSILIQLDIYLDDQIMKYITTQINIQQNIKNFQILDIYKYFHHPTEVLEELIKWEKSIVRNKFFGEQQQQFIVDPITYEQFINPILVQSGFTYQQKTLKSHYQKNGTYDPITRQQFKNELGVKNNVLMSYISQNSKWFTLNQQNNIDL